MRSSSMRLKIFLPSEIILEEERVVRIVAESRSGLFGILPARLDCVACLVPGILIFQVQNEKEHFVAVDEGILVKTGSDVQVAVRDAVVAQEIGTVRQIVRDQFLALNEQQKKVQSMLAKLESTFVRHLIEFAKHG